MDDQALPASIVTNPSKPIQLTPDLDELCKRLDTFYAHASVHETRPSDMLRGALFVMQLELRSNPDQIAQAAHSLREILYHFNERGARDKALTEYGSTYDSSRRDEVGRYQGLLDNLAHHNFTEVGKASLIGGSESQPVVITVDVLEKIVSGFSRLLFEVLRRQLDVHAEIDQLLKKDPAQINVTEITTLLGLNPDARNYFFANANSGWLDYIWSNGLLDEIKKKAEDVTRYSFRLPELDYLTRMAVDAPSQVANILLAVPSSSASFNPEVVDRFLWICSILPASELKRLAAKIRDESWVRLMAKFNRWGFEYEKVLKALSDAKEYESLLIVAEEVLSVLSREDFSTEKNIFTSDSPFYFKDFRHAHIFKYIADVDEINAENALRLVAKVLAQIVSLGEPIENGEFKIYDSLHLYDVDFFGLELGQNANPMHQNDVRELVALCKKLAQRTIGARCTENEAAHRIYNEYILTLPDSQSMYRLRLYILSFCPDTFKVEIKAELFKIFSCKEVHDLLMGPEYLHVVQIRFFILSEEEQREFVAKVLSSFAGDDRLKRDGKRILSCAYSLLTAEEKQRAEEIFGSLNPDYHPEPLITHGRGGMVIPQPPGENTDWQIPVPEIVQKLKNDWSPMRLKETFQDDDFLRPRNAEGVGDRMKKQMEEKAEEYLKFASLFFDRELLHPHYTYSYLRGIYDLLRADKLPADSDLSEVVNLLGAVNLSGAATPFEDPPQDRQSGGWLASWTTVHDSMGDVLQELLNGARENRFIDFNTLRDKCFALIKYLLQHRDPEPKDEQIESASSKVKAPSDQEYKVSDPYSMAINSVRGRAFEALLSFISLDGKRLIPDGKKIADDVTQLYSELLARENTRAIMFMFGHTLPTFYFRDASWLQNQLPSIFSAEADKGHLYQAAWEGYLANNLYQELFFDPKIQELYKRAIDNPTTMEGTRRYSKDIDEGLATHLALAFIHYDGFGLDHPLLKAFWANPDVEQHGEFIGFIGRLFISGANQDADVLVMGNQDIKQKLMNFWDFALENSEVEALTSFDFWMNTKKDIFDLPWLIEQIKKTLSKTEGVIDWDYGLNDSILEMAKISPETTLEILRLHILEAGVRNKQMRIPFYLRNEWVDALKILFENPITKSKTTDLINALIHEGGQPFWGLKEVIK